MAKKSRLAKTRQKENKGAMLVRMAGGIILGGIVGLIAIAAGGDGAAVLGNGLIFAGLLLGGYWAWVSIQKPIDDENNRDYRVSRGIEDAIPAICSQPAIPPIPALGISTYADVRLGEVSRHFDSQLAFSLEGWMDHDFGFNGFGVGLQAGGVGVSLGKLGLSGRSDVHLTMTGIARDNLLGDAFVAVLEKDLPRGGLDTVRVVVPSEPAARQFVGSLLEQWAERFGEGSHTDPVARGAAKTVQGSFRLDVSYVSDRLGAILRMSPARRPTISVAGPELAEHIILGSAIQFQGDDKWYPLFPIALVERLTRLNRSLATDTTSPLALTGKS